MRTSAAGPVTNRTLIILLPCLAIGAVLSVAMGQDANWDLLNYHLYNGFALLHGRFSRDLLPAGMQSYLNPVLDAVYAGLALGPLRAAPRVLAAVTGLWYGMMIFLAARLSMLLYPDRLLAVAATALGVTGAATIAQVGTVTGELQAAVFMLSGLLVMLQGSVPRRIAGGGLLFGLAAGLKLTAAAYAPAALLAAMSLHSLRSPGRWIATTAMFSCGWVAGLAVADGWWASMVARRFASPVFPMFNGLFRSPLYPPASVFDGRFFPHDAAQWLFYPMYWAVHPAALVSELPLRDPRLAVALCLALASLWRRPREPVPRALLVFFGVGYVAWLGTSSILRYAVVLEAVGGVLAPLLLIRLISPLSGAKLLALAMTVVVLAVTRYPVTLRIPYGTRTLHANAVDIPAHTLLVLTFRAPESYLVPLLPWQKSLQVMNVGDTVLDARGWGLHDHMLRMVADHAGPILVLTAGDPRGEFPELGEVGLSSELEHCRAIDSNFAASGPAAQLCAGRKAPPRVLASPFWAQAATHYHKLVQIEDASQSLIGAAYLKAAGSAARGTRFIDWTDLLWSGVGSSHTALPEHLDSASLYVLPRNSLLAVADRLDPRRDLLAQVDGVFVLAPHWRTCATCTASAMPVDLHDYVVPLSIDATPTTTGQAQANGMLAYGWWPQEPTGIWSHEQADLLVPLAADLPEHAALVLKGMLFTPPGVPASGLGAYRVRIEIAGCPASVVEQLGVRPDGPGAIVLPLRREWLRREADHTYLAHVRLSFPDARSPSSVGLSIDGRRLGMWLTGLRLVGVP